MAVKKATAKKSVAKKAAPKNPRSKVTTPKSATSKATTPKKSTVKKVAKKSPVKKSTVKKSVARKAAPKNPRSKATTRKKAVSKTLKKATTKKAATRKSAAKKVAETIVIPEAPILASRNARVEIVSTPMVAAAAPILAPVSAAPVSAGQPQKPGASNRVIFAVVVGIILLGLIVWAKGHNSNSANKPTTAPSATTTPSSTPTPTPSDTAVTLTAHEAPQGVVAQYTTTGATIFWKAPTALTGLSGYNVEISMSNGPWKLISTVPATQLSLDVTKQNGNGWTSFKVSSVYTDSKTVAAKAFGLPGTYS